MAEFFGGPRAPSRHGYSIAGWRAPSPLTLFSTVLLLLLFAPAPQVSASAQATEGATGASADKPAAQGTLSLLDALQLMLKKDPNVALARASVETALGSLEVQQAGFDPLLTASVGGQDSEDPTSETEVLSVEAQSLSAGASQLFRTGLSVSGSLDVTRTETSPGASNVGTISFTIRQPLARGRGRDVTGADERSAELSLEASRLDLQHRIAERVLTVATQYWSLVSAVADLEILRENESRSRRSFENYRRLVEADQVPAADLVQLEADVMSREVARLSAEQTVFERRQDLGFAIGLDAAASSALGLPSDAFPTAGGTTDVDPTAPQLLDAALRDRADMQALDLRQQSAEVLLAAAENALLPRLDLVLTPSYTGFSADDDISGVFNSLTDNIPSLSTTFGLSMSWPLRNRAAKGLLRQSEASIRTRELQVTLLENSITNEVAIAADAVRSSAEQLDFAIRAVGLFERALDNEQKKLRASRSTLLDTITQRDRLTSAQQRQNSAEFALALALIRLRFQTGTLFEMNGDDIVLEFDRLTTAPDAALTGAPSGR